MVSGDFEIRNVPALVEHLDDEKTINSILAIIDPNEDLQLAYYDAKLFSKSSNGNEPKYICATEKIIYPSISVQMTYYWSRHMETP